MGIFEGEFMNRAIRWYDYLTININWFALTTRSQVLVPLVIPLLVQQFVGEAQKGSYVGTLRLWTLMAAVLSQAFFGLLSDHTKTRWGRRKPFIFGGVVFELVVIIAIGFTAGMSGISGYWMLFFLLVLSMVGSNATQAGTQSLIPDLVPDEKKGLFSGIKAALELPIPLIFVSFVVARQISNENLWGALITLSVVLVVSMLISLFAPKRETIEELEPLNWNPFLRLFLMTAAFTALILGVGELVSIFVINSQSFLMVGLVGIFGMAITVFLGVWASIRISLGEEVLQHPSFVWWVINRLGFLVASTNLAGFMVFFLQEKFPEMAGAKAAGPAAQIVMFVGIFILVTAVPSGWLADRFGKKMLLTVAGLLVAGGASIVIFSPSIMPMYAGASLVGAGVGLFYSASWALGAELVPQDQVGRFMGIQNIAGAGAGAIGAYIGGTIADEMSYVLLMSIYAMMALLSLLPLIGVKKAN
jgi:MFS family permease